MSTDRARLYFGKVVHRRLAPVRHGFRYGVFYLRLRVDQMQQRWPRLFSHNGWNLFSFHDADHGPRDGSALLPWIRNLLTQHGLDCADGAIWLQAFPRVLGYVFNPVSFWLCHDRAGALHAVVAEVRNTFGESHNYLVAHPDGRAIMPGDWLTARKVFHVSPFFPVSGHYRFRFIDTGAHCNFRIDYTAADGAQLLTAVSGTAQTLRSPALAWAFLRYPWMTLGVILRIHYQALRLWLKRVPFHSKPQPPFEETT